MALGLAGVLTRLTSDLKLVVSGGLSLSAVVAVRAINDTTSAIATANTTSLPNLSLFFFIFLYLLTK